MATKSSMKPSKKGATPAKSAARKKSKTSASKSDSTASAAPASFSTKDVGRNGLRSFAFHSQDKGATTVMDAIRPKVRRSAGGVRPSAAAARATVTGMDAETAARQYLTNALASDELPTFTAGDANAEKK